MYLFAQKLDFLMKLTNTQNSVLGRAIHVDASTISRLRSGKRQLPKRQDFVAPMSVFFAQHIKDDYQKKSAADAICPEKAWPDDAQWASELICSFLSSEETNSRVVEQMLLGISQMGRQTNIHVVPKTNCETTAVPRYHYGHEGKRQAVIWFLTAVLNAASPRTLLLFSDEDMSWMYEDESFVKNWASLLFQALAKGNRIKIIHSISRSLGDMLEALNKWVPIYMTGMVEPYYYPKLRDEVFHRTLFVAPSLAAVVSTSVGVSTEKALNLYIDDPTAVGALEDEFADYFRLCRPLMRIFKAGYSSQFWKLYSEMEDAGGNAFLVHRGLSLFTMPERVAENICQRSGNTWLSILQAESFHAFEKNISDFTVTEVIRLPPAQEVIDGEISVLLSGFSATGKVCYTRDEYIAHLQNVVYLSQKYQNYCVYVTDSLFDDMIVYCKENSGVIIAQEAISTVFAFNEHAMTVAFEEYLGKELNKIRDKVLHRDVLSCYTGTFFV